MLRYPPSSDYCRLCVKSCNNYQHSLYDETGQANSNHDMVGKYFTSAMLNMEWEQRLQYICEKCWQHIWEFHQFQESIIEAQQGPHLHTEAAKEVVKARKRPKVKLIEQETQLVLPSAKALSTSAEGFIKTTDLSFHIKTEEPLDINSDCEGMSSQSLDQLRDEEVSLTNAALTNDVESNPDFSSNDDMPLSSLSHINLSFSESKCAATKRSVEEFDELVALWRSSLECEICHQLMASYSQLKDHFSKNHTSEICYLMCCQLRLDNRYDLEKHIRYHSAPQQLKCDACCKAFRLVRLLRDHKRKVHTSKGGDKNAKASEKLEVGKYRCCTCLKEFASKTHLYTHNRDVHKTKIFECDICEKSFTRSATLRQHLASHKGEKTHGCSFCPQAFTSRAYCRRHMRTNHSEEWKKMQNESAQKKGEFRQETRGECMFYVCLYCSMEYNNKRSIYNHLNRCQRYDGPIETKSGFRRETRGESVVFVCIYCSKEYGKQISMLNHIKHWHGSMEPKEGYRREIREKNKVYVCSYCSKEYDKYQSMHNHIRQRHAPIELRKGYRLEIRGKSKVYICIYCSKECEKWRSILSHLHRCQRDNVPMEPIKRYRLESRGERMVYVCSYCPKEYNNRFSMCNHFKRCHKDDGSVAKQASGITESPAPSEQQSHYTGIIGLKTTDVSNITSDGDNLNELGKEEEDSMMATMEARELKDENATRANVKTGQFSANTNVLRNGQMYENEMPLEEFIKSEEEFIDL
ncbi:zinc finger protein 184-like [Stomoxys calcitrans]|uniref:zinc finger protein 184-like n=1 Tax=Stomoxys calcitrans TaxID=35570 RepID=UPI0027E26BAC|nr:zinc finger protein 184-like [Stomoxys calcitrans]